MKLEIGDYEVEIKARAIWRGKSRKNEKDTVSFLHYVVNAFFETGHALNEQGFEATAERYFRDAMDVVKVIKEEEVLK